MRDKLIELMEHSVCESGACPSCEHFNDIKDCIEYQQKARADYLISHGVTLQRWIPVDEAKPKLIPNTAGTAYSDAVNALTSGRKVITAIWDGTDFIGDAEFWEAEDEIITHWTPVLLPLPEPPKEGE